MINPTEYLPKSYHPRLSTYWWLTRWAYLKFVLREVSSVFVAWAAVMTLLQIRALRLGPADYAEFQNWLRSPALLALNAVSFCFVVFHAVTWFNLAPKAIVVRFRKKRLPNVAISAPNFVGWLVTSVAITWILLRG